MAPKQAKEPKKKPALKDLRTFGDSQNLTRVMLDTVIALEARVKHDGPGIGVSPDVIKIDTRNGQGLLMDHDVNLNMKAELTMLHPFCQRPPEEIAYYLSVEQSPVGGLKMSYKQWLSILKGKRTEDAKGFPVPPEARKEFADWLHNLHTKFSVNKDTESLIQNIIDAKFGKRKEEGTNPTRGGTRVEVKMAGGIREWEAVPLDSIMLEALDLD